MRRMPDFRNAYQGARTPDCEADKIPGRKTSTATLFRRKGPRGALGHEREDATKLADQGDWAEMAEDRALSSLPPTGYRRV